MHERWPFWRLASTAFNTRTVFEILILTLTCSMRNLLQIRRFLKDSIKKG